MNMSMATPTVMLLSPIGLDIKSSIGWMSTVKAIYLTSLFNTLNAPVLGFQDNTLPMIKSTVYMNIINATISGNDVKYLSLT